MGRCASFFPSPAWGEKIRPGGGEADSNSTENALELTRALALDGKCLRGKCDQDPKLGYELMKRLSALIHARMQAARLQIMDICGPTSA